MGMTHLVHLEFYLRITSLLPLLGNVYEQAQLEHQSPAPTQTIPSAALRAETVIIRPPPAGPGLRITLANVTHIFFNAIKVGAMVWMLTRRMKWTDMSLWIIGGALFGWWLGDAITTIRPGSLWNMNGQRAGGHNPLPGEGANGVDGQGAVDAPLHAQRAAAAGRARTNVISPQSLVTHAIPLVHLDTDAEQLHLSPRRPSSRPFRFVTQLLLPVCLWFVTLIPAWELQRGRAIRQREREMRTRVAELTSASAEIPPAQGMERTTTEGTITDNQEGETVIDAPARPPVLPPGLSSVAIKYYARVIARSEEIDWEEEREAQRAMGVEG